MRQQSLIRTLWSYRRVIVRGTVVAAVAALVIGGVVFVRQESRWTATLEFRPLVVGEETGRYPNALPFSTTDITDRSVVDAVFDLNGVAPLCSREQFRASFAVTKSVDRLRQLDEEYEARLADTKITAVERRLLEEEYQSKREGLAARYQLTFFRAPECSRLSAAVVYKSLTDLLQTWADDADKKRGVLRPEQAVLSSNIFDLGNSSDESPLVRADLVRTALALALKNAREAKLIPGIVTLRAGPDSVNIEEVIVQLEDLLKSMLNPMLAIASRGVGPTAVRWVDESVKTAALAAKAAEGRYLAHLAVLREYSGGAALDAPGDRSPAAEKGQTPLDASVVERIVGLSPVNTAYRQALTDRMIAAQNEFVQAQSAVERYRQLKALLTSSGTSNMTLDEAERELTRVVDAGKTLVGRTNDIIEAFSRIALRPAAGLYQIEHQPRGQTLRTFGLRSYFLLVVGTAVATALLLATGCLSFFHLRALSRSAAESAPAA